ncbi:MAG: hypothetical protein LEGION0403_FIIPPAGN_02631 [Legionella sp.]|uniref:hypothetical protein n=1 Tax=Legionella sp. TaxID=459 RepID=UPI003D101712
MKPYSSLFQYLDENLPWQGAIAIRSLSFFSRIVQPVDEKISELRNRINQTKKDANNLDYVTYYKVNQNSLTFKRMNICKDFFDYSETEADWIKKSNNLSDSDHIQLSVLPPELINEIGNCLPEEQTIMPISEQGRSALSLTSNDIYTTFHPPRLLNALLLSVAHGNQVNAEKILKRYPELLMEKGTLTDYSGRTFKDITAFQYALWALDTRYMCTMMLNCIPQNELGEKIRISLLNQQGEHEINGVTYTLKNKTYQEKHYDCEPLVRVWQEYDDARSYIDPIIPMRSRDDINKDWQELAVGIPAHFSQHYCDLEHPFNYGFEISFTEPVFKRTLNFYNEVVSELKTFFRTPMVAGIFYSKDMTKDELDEMKKPNWKRDRDLRNYMHFFSTLSEVRTKDIMFLKERLATPVISSEENLQSSSSPMF